MPKLESFGVCLVDLLRFLRNQHSVITEPLDLMGSNSSGRPPFILTEVALLLTHYWNI